MNQIQIGRLLRADTRSFVVGCRVTQMQAPAFGALVRVPLETGDATYGLIHYIRIDDDGLVRQLVTAENVDETIVADNRVNRNVPLEISVLVAGYGRGDKIFHLLPPRPPLSLDIIYLCDEAEIYRFTPAKRFGYFRHILRDRDLPIAELLAAHLQQAHAAHLAQGDGQWIEQAAQELIALLRNDHETLMNVLGALSDAVPEAWGGIEERP